MRTLFVFALGFMLLSASCNRTKKAAKDVVHEAGEVVGKGSSEFADGVKDGVDQTFECSLDINKPLKKKGVSYGKFRVKESEHVVSAYLIFEEDFDGTVMLKAYDKDGNEYGRTNLPVKATKSSAGYYDFNFGAQTELESKSKFELDAL